jgi:dTMP kinase
VAQDRGRLITLEGPEGAGKTVVGQRLAAALVAAGHSVVLTREPGGTRLGERLRSLLLESGGRIEPRADALLFNAARAQLTAEILRPAIAAGQVVVCARFADSTLAYQGYGAGVDLDLLRRLEAIATGGLKPDLTILLDLLVEEGLDRKGRGSAALTRFETDVDVDFHRRVREGFLALAAQEPARWRVVDAARPRSAVADAIRAAVREVLPEAA